MEECRAHLRCWDNLLDREERQHTIDVLRTYNKKQVLKQAVNLLRYSSVGK